VHSLGNGSSLSLSHSFKFAVKDVARSPLSLIMRTVGTAERRFVIFRRLGAIVLKAYQPARGNADR
jgi:hypothetical protein